MTSGPPTAADLEVFLAERGTLLLRSAVLLAGSREAGEDLLQAALERMLRHWRAIDGDPEGYLRRTIYNLATDRWRRQRRWRDRLHQLQPPPGPEGVEIIDLRDQLARLVDQLPPKQRAVIVLRYWEQLPAQETAELLGCSVGTIKATAFRGMQRLRELSRTASKPDPAETTHE
jgi:RNA polymerase sigma-70 factor (sigma-E family)